jgi:putative aldouronate transport system permease protein
MLAVVCFLTFYPFWNQLVISFSSTEAYYRDWYHIVPKSFSLEAYRYNLQNPQVFRSFYISVIVTASGTVLSLLITAMTAFFLSKSFLPGRNMIFILFVLTMFLQGGLIPFYVLVTQLGLRNSLLALIMPYLLNVYFIILMKNYFQSLPHSLEESATIDGANDFLILFSIIIPVSKPIMATITLFYAVFYWNGWFPAMLFINQPSKYPLALYLRGIIAQAVSSIDTPTAAIEVQIPATVRASVMMITILPIICVYPFLQKHFVKGIMLGAVKS